MVGVGNPAVVKVAPVQRRCDDYREVEMKRFRVLGIFLVFMLGIACSLGQSGQTDSKKRLLAVGMSAGWQHDSVSDALVTMYNLGKETGLWETYVRTDTELITKKKTEMNAKNLDFFDEDVYSEDIERLEPDEEEDIDPSKFEKKKDILSFYEDEYIQGNDGEELPEVIEEFQGIEEDWEEFNKREFGGN